MGQLSAPVPRQRQQLHAVLLLPVERRKVHLRMQLILIVDSPCQRCAARGGSHQSHSRVEGSFKICPLENTVMTLQCLHELSCRGLRLA